MFAEASCDHHKRRTAPACINPSNLLLLLWTVFFKACYWI